MDGNFPYKQMTEMRNSKSHNTKKFTENYHANHKI